MPTNYLVIVNPAPGAKTSNMRYHTVADALKSAKALMGEDSRSVYIFDGEGYQVLSSDQVRHLLRWREAVPK